MNNDFIVLNVLKCVTKHNSFEMTHIVVRYPGKIYSCRGKFLNLHVYGSTNEIIPVRTRRNFCGPNISPVKFLRDKFLWVRIARHNYCH